MATLISFFMALAVVLLFVHFSWNQRTTFRRIVKSIFLRPKPPITEKNIPYLLPWYNLEKDTNPRQPLSIYDTVFDTVVIHGTTTITFYLLTGYRFATGSDLEHVLYVDIHHPDFQKTRVIRPLIGGDILRSVPDGLADVHPSHKVEPEERACWIVWTDDLLKIVYPGLDLDACEHTIKRYIADLGQQKRPPYKRAMFVEFSRILAIYIQT